MFGFAGGHNNGRIRQITDNVDPAYTTTYNYDAANRLNEVGVGGSNTYGYDGDGMRVRQTSGGTAMF